MAQAHLAAYVRIRDLDLVQVYSPTKAHRNEFAAEMNEQFDI